MTQYCIIQNPADTRATKTVGPRLNLTYEISPDGEITVTLPNGLKLVGRISKDYQTIMLNSAHQEQTGPAGGPTGYQICNIGRVLIRVKQVDD